MNNEFEPLKLYSLAAGAGYFRPRQDLPERITPNAPAVSAMTDLRQVSALTIEPGATIDRALSHMIEGGVRLLLVVHAQGTVLGLITATDIQGEKPMRFRSSAGLRHAEILVRDIMTPHERLEVMLYEDVLRARVGEVIATLRRSGRQHALVVDTDSATRLPSIRGIFSTTRIARQIGAEITLPGQAASFAELGAALGA